MKTLGWPPNFVARCPVKLFEAAGGSNSWLPCGTAGEFHMRPLGNAVLHFQLRDLLDNQILFEHTMRKPDAFIVSAQRFFVIRLENGSFRGFGFADGAAAYEMKKQVQKAVKPYSIQESGGESFARASPADEPKASTSDRQLQTTGSTDKKVSTVVSYESVPRRSSGRPSQLSKEQRMPSVPCLEVATFSPTPKSSMFRSKWKLVLKGFTSLSHLKSLSAISQVLGWREHEMEIGYPTDVKHVAHIGWDGPSVGGPNWVNDSSPTSFWFHLKGFCPKNPIYHYFSMKKFHGSRADNVKHCHVMQIDELKPSPDFSSGPLREFCQPRGSDWIHDALSAAKWAAPGLGENFGPPPGPPAEFSDSDMVQLGQRSSKWKFFRSRHKSMAPPNELPCPPQNIKCQYNPS